MRSPASLAWTHADMDHFLSFCHRRRYPGKTVLVRPGDPENTLFYVLSGSLSLIVEEDDGREIILTYANSGAFIGEAGLLSGSPRAMMAIRTRAACELAEIGYERLFQLLDGELGPDASRLLFHISAQLAHRWQIISGKVGRMAYVDVPQRVARTLLDLCEEPDSVPLAQGRQISISRLEMSRIVGCSREMVGRVLKQMEEHELVRVKGKAIIVLDHGSERGARLIRDGAVSGKRSAAAL